MKYVLTEIEKEGGYFKRLANFDGEFAYDLKYFESLHRWKFVLPDCFEQIEIMLSCFSLKYFFYYYEHHHIYGLHKRISDAQSVIFTKGIFSHDLKAILPLVAAIMSQFSGFPLPLEKVCIQPS